MTRQNLCLSFKDGNWIIHGMDSVYDIHNYLILSLIFKKNCFLRLIIVLKKSAQKFQKAYYKCLRKRCVLLIAMVI